MKKFLVLLAVVFFCSCQQKENTNNSVAVTDSADVKKNTPEIKKNDNEENKQIGDTIFMNFKNEKDVFAAEGVLDSIHPRVFVKFKNEDVSELTGNIIPAGGKGNIRFNQIIFPDKSMDGPFGMEVKFQLKQKGNYVLVIGHSQMADNPFYGKFEIQLQNKTN